MIIIDLVLVLVIGLKGLVLVNITAVVWESIVSSPNRVQSGATAENGFILI